MAFPESEEEVLRGPAENQGPTPQLCGAVVDTMGV